MYVVFIKGVLIACREKRNFRNWIGLRHELGKCWAFNFYTGPCLELCKCWTFNFYTGLGMEIPARADFYDTSSFICSD